MMEGNSLPEILDRYWYIVFIFPAIVALTGFLEALNQTFFSGTGIAIRIDSGFIMIMGILSLISVGAAKWSERHRFARERAKLKEREARVERQNRLRYSVNEFPEKFGESNEPRRGKTEAGFVVYAGKARSDNVYVIYRDEEGEIQKATDEVHDRIKQELETQSVDWIDE